MARYEMDNASFGRFMVSNQMQEPVRDVCDAIAKRAAQLAPKGKTGRLAAGFKAQDGGLVVAGRNALRVSGVVVNDVPYAAAIEFGTKRGGEAVRMLGKAAIEFGDYRGTAE